MKSSFELLSKTTILAMNFSMNFLNKCVNVIPKSQKQNSKKAEKSILSAFFSFISHIFLIDTDQGQIN